MKAKELKKIYVSRHSGLHFFKKHDNDDIEYVQTTDFIEKACEFLFDNYHGEKLSLKMIEDFKKYMED